MKEIEVVVDVRQIPNTLDLLVVRQKLRAEGEEVHLVGEAKESKISLATRKARVTLEFREDSTLGSTLVAHVLNIGFAFLLDVKVTLECLLHDSSPVDVVNGPSAQEIAFAYGFAPVSRKSGAPLLPAESRAYFLPSDLFEKAVRDVRGLSTDNYAVVVRAGDDEVGRLPGAEAAPFLELPAKPRVRMNRRFRAIHDSLSSADKDAAATVLKLLEEKDPSQWNGAGQYQGSNDLYLLPITPELQLVIRRLKGMDLLEVIDVVRTDAVQRLSGMMS